MQRISMGNVEDCAALIAHCIRRRSGRPLTDEEHDELLAEGFAILTALYSTYDPARDKNPSGKTTGFFGFALYHLPGKLSEAWHRMNEHHYYGAADGKRQWMYLDEPERLDGPDPRSNDGSMLGARVADPTPDAVDVLCEMQRGIPMPAAAPNVIVPAGAGATAFAAGSYMPPGVLASGLVHMSEPYRSQFAAIAWGGESGYEHKSGKYLAREQAHAAGIPVLDVASAVAAGTIGVEAALSREIQRCGLRPEDLTPGDPVG